MKSRDWLLLLEKPMNTNDTIYLLDSSSCHMYVYITLETDAAFFVVSQPSTTVLNRIYNSSPMGPVKFQLYVSSLFSRGLTNLYNMGWNFDQL